MNEIIVVQSENFKDFKIGYFHYDKNHSALGEYHCIIPDGYKGNWYDPVTYHGWNGSGPTWIITEENNTKYMEQTRVLPTLKGLWPMLITGDNDWHDYIIEAKIRMLSTVNDSYTGVLFRYVHARCFYAVCFHNKKLELLFRNQDILEVIDSIDFDYNCDHFYNLKIECNSNEISVFVQDDLYIKTKHNYLVNGKIGITSCMPAQFTNISIKMRKDSFCNFINKKRIYEYTIEGKRKKYSKPVLWRVIDLKDFGAGRQIRFGHLLGTDEMFIVIAQHQKRVHRDAYANISCLTAINLNGDVLWQIGEPSDIEENKYISADLPFQVYDIDSDGIDEVIVAKNFKIMILDGITGKIKKQIYTPLSTETDDTLLSIPFGKYAFDRVNIDCIRIINVRGRKKPADILVKDRYNRIWVYDDNFNLLWKFQMGNTGHFPFSADLDGDEKEEVIVGYNLLDHDGRLLWSLPIQNDHTDEIIVGNFSSDDETTIAMVCGDEGFLLVDLNGKIKSKHMIGHAQRISIGKYRNDLQNYQMCISTYWGYQGIIYLFDCNGNIIHQFESPINGNVITPVNWTGDGNDLILLNGHPQYGGLIDGYGDTVVLFPNDGHPVLCADAVNLTGDARDEIIFWDDKKMYIYTQEDNIKSNVKIPIKYHLYNASNYRGEYSFYNN